MLGCGVGGVLEYVLVFRELLSIFYYVGVVVFVVLWSFVVGVSLIFIYLLCWGCVVGGVVEYVVGVSLAFVYFLLCWGN